MAGLVDIALPAAAQAAAETLGLTVQRSVTSGARVRNLPRDEAQLAIEKNLPNGVLLHAFWSILPEMSPARRAPRSKVRGW